MSERHLGPGAHGLCHRNGRTAHERRAEVSVFFTVRTVYAGKHRPFEFVGKGVQRATPRSIFDCRPALLVVKLL